jgi:hypothetical protein
MNRRTRALKSPVPGRIHASALPPYTHGRQPKLGYITRALIPRPYNAQLDIDDLHMISVPLAFHQGLREWIKIPLPRNAPVSACHFCDEWANVTYHGGHMVLGKLARDRPPA